jgi:hypothetical protein
MPFYASGETDDLFMARPLPLTAYRLLVSAFVTIAGTTKAMLTYQCQ